MAKVKDVEGEWMEIALLGEVLTVGVMRMSSGTWQVTLAGWGQSSSSEAAFGRLSRRLDTSTAFGARGEAKKSVEDALILEGVREWGAWKGFLKNRSDCNDRVRCSSCGKERNRWDAEAHKAKTPTGIGFFCRKPECLNSEPQKQLEF
jgi:hypothetical protein